MLLGLLLLVLSLLCRVVLGEGVVDVGLVERRGFWVLGEVDGGGVAVVSGSALASTPRLTMARGADGFATGMAVEGEGGAGAPLRLRLGLTQRIGVGVGNGRGSWQDVRLGGTFGGRGDVLYAGELVERLHEATGTPRLLSMLSGCLLAGVTSRAKSRRPKPVGASPERQARYSKDHP